MTDAGLYLLGVKHACVLEKPSFPQKGLGREAWLCKQGGQDLIPSGEKR